MDVYRTFPPKWGKWENPSVLSMLLQTIVCPLLSGIVYLSYKIFSVPPDCNSSDHCSPPKKNGHSKEIALSYNLVPLTGFQALHSLLKTQCSQRHYAELAQFSLQWNPPIQKFGHFVFWSPKQNRILSFLKEQRKAGPTLQIMQGHLHMYVFRVSHTCLEKPFAS